MRKKWLIIVKNHKKLEKLSSNLAKMNEDGEKLIKNHKKLGILNTFLL